jgi:hypothetical protein
VLRNGTWRRSDHRGDDRAAGAEGRGNRQQSAWSRLTPDLREAFTLEPFANAIARYENGGTLKPINSEGVDAGRIEPVAYGAGRGARAQDARPV